MSSMIWAGLQQTSASLCRAQPYGQITRAMIHQSVRPPRLSFSMISESMILQRAQHPRPVHESTIHQPYQGRSQKTSRSVVSHHQINQQCPQKLSPSEPRLRIAPATVLTEYKDKPTGEAQQIWILLKQHARHRMKMLRQSEIIVDGEEGRLMAEDIRKGLAD